MVFSQSNGDTADTMAGLHVSILNSLSELLLKGQHLRNQFQQSVHISTTHGHTNTNKETPELTVRSPVKEDELKINTVLYK